jgi:hypothetical protein
VRASNVETSSGERSSESASSSISISSSIGAQPKVDSSAAAGWLDAADAGTMIHGHTHRPADHALPGGRRRIVLSDWDAAAMSRAMARGWDQVALETLAVCRSVAGVPRTQARSRPPLPGAQRG